MKVVLLAVVVALVLIGLPLPVGAAGMADMACPDCDTVPMAHAWCVAVVAGAGTALWITVTGWRLRPATDAGAGLNLRFGPERPPRLA